MSEIIPWYVGDPAEQVRNRESGGPNVDQLARNLIYSLQDQIFDLRDDEPGRVIDGGSPNDGYGA